MAGSNPFTYYSYDLLTQTPKGEVPFRDVTFGRILNDSGEFDGEVNAADLPTGGTDIIGSTETSKSLLAIDYEGTLVWCGIIWTRDYDDLTKVVRCTGKELWSYFERRQQVDYTSPPSFGYWSGNPATATDICEQFLFDVFYDVGSGVSGPILVGANGLFMNSGTSYTSIDLTGGLISPFKTPVPMPLASGTDLWLLYNNGTRQQVTLTANASQGDTTLHVASFSPTTTIVGSPGGWQPFSVTTPEVVAQIMPIQGWPPQMILTTSIDTSHLSQGLISPTFPKQQRQTIEALVRQHATTGIGTGFDFSLDSSWLFGPGGPITSVMTLYFPTKGASQYAVGIGVDGLMIDLDSAITYVWSEDGTQQSSKVYAVGQSKSFLEQDVSSSSALAAGYPLLEQLFPFIMVNTNDELLAAAQGELSLVAYPVAAPKITLPVSGDEPALGQFNLGDTMRVFSSSTTDPRWPSGLETEMRCVEWEVHVPDEGLPTMDLTLNIPPVIDPPRPTSLGL